MRCPSCKYDLQNLTEHRCPECGREFDPNDASTFLIHRSRARFWISVAFVVASLSWVLLFAHFYFYGGEDVWPAEPWNRPTLPTSYLINSFLDVAVVAWLLAFVPAFLLTLLLGAVVASLECRDADSSAPLR